jgi:hypothetical protein
MHSDYVLGVTEKHKLRFAVDMFNIVNMKRVTGLNEFEDNSFGVPNVDFQTVSAYQRPFYARFGVRWEF